MGGKDEPGNLRAACLVCNEGARNLTLDRPSLQKLLIQVRRATGADQQEVLRCSLRRKIIFVHGCSWHQHRGCIDGHAPKSNAVYRSQKLANNRKRDRKNRSKLRNHGWACLVIWECETFDRQRLRDRIMEFLAD